MWSSMTGDVENRKDRDYGRTQSRNFHFHQSVTKEWKSNYHATSIYLSEIILKVYKICSQNFKRVGTQANPIIAGVGFADEWRREILWARSIFLLVAVSLRLFFNKIPTLDIALCSTVWVYFRNVSMIFQFLVRFLYVRTGKVISNFWFF